jgi:hypothetical protein
MNRQEQTDYMNRICIKLGCNDKQRERHVKAYVDDNWRVHVTRPFQAWWKLHPDCNEDPRSPYKNNVIPAYNCQCYQDQYNECKELGFVNPVEPPSNEQLADLREWMKNNAARLTRAGKPDALTTRLIEGDIPF